MTDAPFEFHKIAITLEQIAEYNLPERPTKTTDRRAKNWQGGSVELDALDPDDLQEIVRETIEQHIPTGWLERIKVSEEAERESLRDFISAWQ